MATSIKIKVRDKGGNSSMGKQKDRDKARKRMFKFLKEAMDNLEKAENDNMEWQFIPEEVFKEILEVLGRIEIELTKTEP
jgi:hypothetical protein